MSRDLNLFDINVNKLDEEWVRQPRSYHEEAVRLADLRAEYLRAKAARDVVKAEVNLAIRRDPASYGISKPTEEAYKSAATTVPRLIDAENAVIQALLAMDHAAAIVDALEHKKYALQNLVQLEGRDYFASPRSPIGATGKVARQKEADELFSIPRRRQSLTEESE